MIEAGTTIDGRYEVESLLGEGGLAHVYRVRHLELGSRHALKLLQFRNQGLADRLLLEGRIQAQLRHPNVVAVTDVIRHDGQFGLLMEYVDHLSLEELITRQGPLSPDVALDLFAPILAGVHAAHRAGVLHRDLKPANVLLARTPQGLVPKVSDFGIAKVIAEGLDGSTRDGVAMGTPGYMAPEQVLDARSVDARTDIFALGSILYELITGRRAFADDTGEVTVRATLRATVPPACEVIEGVPRGLSEAIERALAKEREDRFPDVLEFARAVLATRPSLLALVESTAGAAAPTLTPDLLGLRGPSVELQLARSHGPTLAPEPALPTTGGDDEPVAPVAPRRRSRAALWVMLGGAGAAVILIGALVAAVSLRDPDIDPATGGEQAGSAVAATPPGPVPDAADGASDEVPASSATDPATEPATGDGVGDAQGASRPEASGSSGETTASGSPSLAEPSIDAPPPATVADPAASLTGPDAPAVAGDTATAAPSGETDEPVVVDAAARPGPDPAAPAAGTADTAPSVVDTPAVAPPSPAWLVGSSYEGKLFRQPFTLRITKEQGGEIGAEGRVIQGVSQRLVSFSGSYDAATSVVSLREVNGDLMIDGVINRGELRGTYQRKARGEPELLELVRR